MAFPYHWVAAVDREAVSFGNFWQGHCFQTAFRPHFSVTKAKKAARNPSQSARALVHTPRARRLCARGLPSQEAAGTGSITAPSVDPPPFRPVFR
jgi:hypothetical protein